MEQKEKLSRALRKIFWGYILLYFDINLGTLDLLPAWVGYLFFHRAIQDSIEIEEESAKLLKPICIVLVIYRLVDWFVVMLGLKMDILIINELFAVIALYFHFQFLTNLANIADKYSCFMVNTLLTLRNVHTILMTILAFTIHFEEIEWLSLILIVTQIMIMICICGAIRKFRHAIDDIPEEVFYKGNIET